MLLVPERLNRLVEQEARGTLRSFTLAGVLQQLQTALFKVSAAETPMQAEIRRNIQQLFLNKLLSVAAADAATPAVKGAFLLKINTLETELKQELTRATNVGEQGNLTYLLNQIRLFREKPGDFKPVPGPGIPPGQPIGCGDE